MVIVYFGTPQFAVPALQRLIDSRHTVAGVVTQPDRPRGRGQKVVDGPVKALALHHRLPVIQPTKLIDPAVAAALTAWAPDIGVVAAYGRLIPESLLSIPRHGMINVHASLLPKYRGAAPVHRAVIDGEPQTGVTIMRLVKLLDAGAMFARRVRPITPDETSDAVEHDLSQLGADLLLEVLDQIEAGTASEEPQDDMLSTYAPKITREDGLIDWTLPAVYIHNRTRGLYPWPHTYTFLDSARLIVLRTKVVDPAGAPGESGEQNRSHLREGDAAPESPVADAAPGTIVDVRRDAIVVATGHGGRIALEEVQPEGKRPMKARDYLAGRPLVPGTRFTNAPRTAPGGPGHA